MRIIGVIPARYGSTRFPGKVLAHLCGTPVLIHVIRNAKKAQSLEKIIVATDDERVAKAAEGHCEVVMTRPDHESGTDRVAEVAETMECDAVVNIQGDEPLIAPEVIDAVAEGLRYAPMSTAASRLRSQRELEDPNVVKVVRSFSGRALYFSRWPIPYRRGCGGASLEGAEGLYLRHIGVYGYRRETLLTLVRYPPTPLELAEKLEQLRALEHDIDIHVCVVDWDGVGIDVPEDIARAEALLRGAKRR